MFIAVDFDGTIADHKYRDIGKPVPGAFEWLRTFQELGAKLILWTMRSDCEQSGPMLSQAIEFCSEHGVDFDSRHNSNLQTWTTSPKAYAHVYIDDAAFGCPLVENPNGGRPYVDWNVVGPAVVKLIEESL